MKVWAGDGEAAGGRGGVEGLHGTDPAAGLIQIGAGQAASRVQGDLRVLAKRDPLQFSVFLLAPLAHPALALHAKEQRKGHHGRSESESQHRYSTVLDVATVGRPMVEPCPQLRVGELLRCLGHHGVSLWVTTCRSWVTGWVTKWTGSRRTGAEVIEHRVRLVYNFYRLFLNVHGSRRTVELRIQNVQPAGSTPNSEHCLLRSATRTGVCRPRCTRKVAPL
jgi:hypothetical protein